MEKKETLLEFIRRCYPYFTIDENNHPILMRMHLLATRNPVLLTKKYALPMGDYQENLSIDKGILLIGPVGVGKSDLMRIYQRYLRYLESPYYYSMHVSWKLAKDYERKGAEALSLLDRDNLYFDELCLIEEESGLPETEWVNYYGNRKLMGKVIVNERYEAYKWKGLVTHFSTNANYGELERVYKNRTVSRLTEMCNILPYVGPDRRKKNCNPVIFMNTNEERKAPAPKVVEPPKYNDEDDEVIKQDLQRKYLTYCTTGSDIELNWMDYEFLRSYGFPVAPPEYVQEQLMPCIREERKAWVEKTERSTSADEAKRLNQLRKQYADGTLDEEELLYISRRAYKVAIINLFEFLNGNKYTQIFNYVIAKEKGPVAQPAFTPIRSTEKNKLQNQKTE